MTVGAPAAPDTVVAIGDPGDDTAQRYRYQWIMAAVACCMLLDDIENISEVFCEHHEDVLLKHTDGRFTGQQVKTRGHDQPVWKTSDDAVKKSCIRFARLERQFGDYFLSFQFLTNHPMHMAQNSASLPYVLKECSSSDSSESLPATVRAFVKRIASAAECDIEIAFKALSKSKASDDFPKLKDAPGRLIDSLIPLWPQAKTCSTEALRRVSDRLINACSQASALAHEDLLPAYLPMASNSDIADLKARIDGKRFTKDRLLLVLDQGFNQAAPLHGDPAQVVLPGEGNVDLLHAKLDAGGFSLPSIHAAEELRNKADYLGLMWSKKYGESHGLQQYDHVRSVVLVESAEAFEDEKSNQHFGLQMRNSLRKRLQKRKQNGANFYDCSDDHLEGFAYALTSQCKIQWSIDRPWEKKK